MATLNSKVCTNCNSWYDFFCSSGF